MNKIAVASSVVAVVAVAIFFTLGGEKETKVAKTHKIEKSIKSSSDSELIEVEDKIKKVKKVAKKDKKPQVQEKLVIEENNIDEELEDLHQEYSFESVSVAELSQEIPPREFVEPVSAVVMPKDEFTTLHVGNKISFPDIEGMNYSVELKGVEPMDGSNSFFGEIESPEGISYTTIVTVGDDGTGYIHLATSKGVYEIELKNGKGYVYRSHDIHEGMGDDKKDDFITKKFTQNMEQ